MALFTCTAKLDPGAYSVRCVRTNAVHHAVGISCHKKTMPHLLLAGEVITHILLAYEGRLPLTSWWRKSSNMTVGQSSLISLTHITTTDIQKSAVAGLTTS